MVQFATPQKLPSVIGCSVTFQTWSYVWCLLVRPNPHYTQICHNSFDIACIQCGHSHSQQQIPFAYVSAPQAVWIGPKLSNTLRFDISSGVVLDFADGRVVCRVCPDDDGDTDTLVYIVVGVGLFIILVTILAVAFFANNRQQEVKSDARARGTRDPEEDKYTMARKWQINYTKNTLKD